jgi:hypothetical protein
MSPYLGGGFFVYNFYFFTDHMEAVLVLGNSTRKRNLYFFASQAMTEINSV